MDVTRGGCDKGERTHERTHGREDTREGDGKHWGLIGSKESLLICHCLKVHYRC